MPTVTFSPGSVCSSAKLSRQLPHCPPTAWPANSAPHRSHRRSDFIFLLRPYGREGDSEASFSQFTTPGLAPTFPEIINCGKRRQFLDRPFNLHAHLNSSQPNNLPVVHAALTLHPHFVHERSIPRSAVAHNHLAPENEQFTVLPRDRSVRNHHRVLSIPPHRDSSIGQFARGALEVPGDNFYFWHTCVPSFALLQILNFVSRAKSPRSAITTQARTLGYRPTPGPGSEFPEAGALRAAIRHRSSSSTSFGFETVCATSVRTSARKRLRNRCSATLTAPALSPRSPPMAVYISAVPSVRIDPFSRSNTAPRPLPRYSVPTPFNALSSRANAHLRS